MEEKYGEVEEMNVCDNLGDHLVGNVYVKVRVRDPMSAMLNSPCIHLRCDCVNLSGETGKSPVFYSSLSLGSSTFIGA